MSRGFTDTISKQSSSRHNGKPPVLLGQKPDSEQGILPGRHEEIKRGFSQKTLVLWASSRWMIYHDRAPAHTSNLVQLFQTKHGTIQEAHPLYSPDMSPPDFVFFPKIKYTLKGHTGFKTLKP
ncbi:hypothetical protein TNCV_3188941 [Trichonephila clavipes]|nr:hypothetical protein TNCV_3188941 [Trichonephila clavipes]